MIYQSHLKNGNLPKPTPKIQAQRSSPGYIQGDGDGLEGRYVGDGKTNSSDGIGIYCVTTKEMKEAEEKAFQQGISSEQLVQSVAHGIARHPEFQKCIPHSSSPILLLVGRGMNGIDCLTLGCELVAATKKVAACFLSGRKPSALFDLLLQKFHSLGGTTIAKESLKTEKYSLIIDGLLGTGSKAIKDDELHDIIEKANTSKTPIIAIDIPSGIHPDTGIIFDTAIKAQCTFTCQAPKIGCFLDKAWEYVGELYVIDINLPIPATQWSYITVQEAAQVLPSIERTTHKYKKGTVSLYAGSREMVGAPALAARAAFMSGAGYVRAFTQKEAYEASLSLPLETVRVLYDITDIKSLPIPEKGSLLLGPGLGRGQHVEKLVHHVLKTTNLPCVIDGDALHYLPKTNLPHAILTPHRGEAEALWNISFEILSNKHIDLLSSFAKSSQTCIILKGSPTFIFTPEGHILVMGLGTPALATAGTGDVLSGILSSLLAQGLSRESSCLLGTTLHALAGKQAAQTQGISCVMASHVIDALPFAFAILKQHQRDGKEKSSQ